MDTDTDICRVYRQICLDHKVPIDTIILSRFNHTSVHYGELNLSNTTITDTYFSIIAETLKLVPTITILNLSDCLLSFNGLKNCLDILEELNNLLQLNLKGNLIGKHLTAYISKILNKTNITELHLNWNNIGNSVETFAQLCNSLMSNTVLNTLNLANNNLCQNCGFHLAKMLNINKCLKNLDLSWNFIGEVGAVLLLKCLKNNDILLELNIQGNSVTLETSKMIAIQLKQNKSIKIIQKDIQEKNVNLFEHVASIDKNYETQLSTLNSQHYNQINTLKLKIQQLQIENQQQQNRCIELENNNLKEKENNGILLNQLEKLKSEFLIKKQNLKSLVKKMSNEISHSDLENMSSLEDMEKIIYIIKQVKKKYSNKYVKKTQVNKTLFDTLPVLTNKLNTIKEELKNLKTSIKNEINNCFDYMTDIKKSLLTSITQFKISKQIDDEVQKMYSKHFIELQDGINISVEQTKMLILLNSNFKTLYQEKKDLEIKLAKTEIQFVVNAQTVKSLENSLKLANDELQKLKNEQESKIIAQNSNKHCADIYEKLINTLKINLVEKDNQLKLCEAEKQNLNTRYITELSALEKPLQLEKQNFKEIKEQNQKEIEEFRKVTKYYFNKLLKKDDQENKIGLE